MTDDQTNDDMLVGRLLSSYERREYSWRSTNRLARGKITILDGDPGLGKSTLLAAWAALVTRGEALWDGTPQPERGVILLSAEDDPHDTIRPRIEAAGGDLDRVMLINELPETDKDGNPLYYPTGDIQKRLFNFPDDSLLLEQAIEHMNAGLVVVDPLFGFLSPDVKVNSDPDIRRALNPLALMAQRTGVSVILVRHLNKSGGVNSLYRGGGSIGIIGLARIGLLLGRSKRDEKMRVLAGTLNNIGPLPKSLGFYLESVEGTGVAMMSFVGEVNESANDLLIGEIEDQTDADEADECVDWLRDLLTAGPREKADVMKQGKNRGFSERAIKKAKSKLNIKSNPGGFQGSWLWTLPPPIRVFTKDGKVVNNGDDLEY